MNTKIERQPAGLFLGMSLLIVTFFLGCGGSGGSSGGGGGNGNPPATVTTYSLSGTVSGAIQQNVIIALTGNQSQITTTDASGTYSFSELPDGNYIVTPCLDNYMFAPANPGVTISGANVTGVDFTSSNVLDTNYISFTTEGSSFQPVIVVDGSPTITWTWSDGSTSNSATPSLKDFGTDAKRVHTLAVDPWSAVRRINIGYDAGDYGDPSIEFVDDQHVSAVQGLELVAPYLQQWCSSYNELTVLNFNNFTNLDTIECYYSERLTFAFQENTPNLSRACFDACNFKNIDLSESPLLEEVMAAKNNQLESVSFGNAVNANTWHICIHTNPHLNNSNLFGNMELFPNIAELLIWDCNQSGELSVSSTRSYIDPLSASANTRIMAYGNQYTSLNLQGALQDSSITGEVKLNNNELTQVNITGCSQITKLNLRRNELDDAQINSILQTLDSLGRSTSGSTYVVDLRENPGVLNSDGLTAAQNLFNKGWNVYTLTHSFEH